MTFTAVDRRNTYAVKWEERKSKFGTDDLLPLWVADMDLASPATVQKAMIDRARHPIYGYTIYPELYYDAIDLWMKKRFGWEVEREWIVPANTRPDFSSRPGTAPSRWISSFAALRVNVTTKTSWAGTL